METESARITHSQNQIGVCRSASVCMENHKLKIYRYMKCNLKVMTLFFPQNQNKFSQTDVEMNHVFPNY